LDGEFAPAIIQWKTNEKGKKVPFAVYHTGYKEYAIDALYLFREYQSGDRVTVIYEAATPSKGAVYHWWGYWITWQELLGGMLIIFLLFQLARAVTSNPTPEALLEQMEYTAPIKKKYID
jgi:hypothetical protein